MHIQSHVYNLLTGLKIRKYDVSLCLERRAAFMKKKCRSMALMSLLVKACALAGFLTQMNCIVGKYLCYDTEVTIKYPLDWKMSSSNINLCIPMAQFFSEIYQIGVRTLKKNSSHKIQQFFLTGLSVI